MAEKEACKVPRVALCQLLSMTVVKSFGSTEEQFATVPQNETFKLFHAVTVSPIPMFNYMLR